MSDYALDPEALADIDEIWRYIANDSMDAADRAIETIFEDMARLAASPSKDMLVATSRRRGFVLAGVQLSDHLRA